MPAQPYPPPRSWPEEPGVFGKGSGKARWKPAESDDEAVLIRAARLQHSLARRVRQLIQDHRTSVAAVAEKIGVSADMINDALNGITHLHVTTLDAVANALGLRLTIEIAPWSDKTPS